VLSDDAYLDACRRAKLIALTDWTLYPHMTRCWDMLLERVYGRLTHRPPFFFDLVDPSSRTDADIAGMLEVLKKFQACGDVILGLNGNEANIVSRVLGLPSADSSPGSLRVQSRAIRSALG